jgi:hypothetical protein
MPSLSCHDGNTQALGPVLAPRQYVPTGHLLLPVAPVDLDASMPFFTA